MNEANAKSSKLIGKGSALIRAAFGVVLFTSFQYFAQVIFYNLGFDGVRNEGLFNFSYGILVSVLLFIYIRITKKPGEGNLIYRDKMNIPQWVLVVIIGLGMLAWVSLYFDLAHYISELMPKVKQSVSEYQTHVGRSSETKQFVIPKWDHVLYVLGVTLAIPLVEELAFRGLVLGELRKQFSPAVSIIMSGLFFGVLHVQPVQVIYAVFCGVILGAVYYCCDSIWASFTIHAIFNFMGSGVSQMMKSGLIGVGEKGKNAIYTGMTYIEFIMLLPSVFALTFLFVLHNKKKAEANAKEEVEVANEQA